MSNTKANNLQVVTTYSQSVEFPVNQQLQLDNALKAKLNDLGDVKVLDIIINTVYAQDVYSTSITIIYSKT